MLDPDILEEFVSNHAPSHKQNSVSWIFNCPRCLKSNKLYIRKRDGRFVCFSCSGDGGKGFRGNCEYALSELCGLPFKQVVEALYGVNAKNIDHKQLVLTYGDFIGEQDEIELEVNEIPEVAWPLHFFPIDHKHAIKGAHYMESRGVDQEIASLYGVRYNAQDRAVVFPITHEGKLVGWQQRMIGPSSHWDEERAKYVKHPKTLTSKGVPKDRTLMFGDLTLTGDYAIICEGPIDALHCALAGGSVATMGKAVSRAQIELIRSKGVKRIYLALDPDALVEVRNLLREFSDLPCFSMIAPAPYSDIGEMPMEAVLKLFQDAKRIDLGSFISRFRRQ